jgi:hypothetical protein
MRLNPKTLVLTFCITVVFLSLSCASLNLMVDPAGNFFSKHDVEKKMANALSNSQSVSFTGEIDDQALQYYRLNNIAPKNEIVLVVGSSRGWQISSKTIQKEVFNLSVGAASIDEQAAFIFLALKKLKINKIIIQLDPWMFNKYFIKVMPPILTSAYQDSAKHWGFGQQGSSEFSFFNTVNQLLSLEYTKESLRKLRRMHEKSNSAAVFSLNPTGSLDKDRMTVHPDGSMDYSYAYSHMSNLEKNQKFKQWQSDYPAKTYIARKVEYSPSKYSTLLSVLNAVPKSIKIVLLLQPVSPMAYQVMSERTPDLMDIESKIKEVQLNNVEVIGSFNPKYSDCDESDFFDAIHPKSSCIKKIFNIK